MTELEKYDSNGNGKIDPEELAVIELEDRRRRMEDEDAQRDQQRKMVWFVLFGMLGYPFFVIGAAVLGLEKASDILGSMATIYFPATSLILASFFGASAYAAKKQEA
jgi:hypothetical protein